MRMLAIETASEACSVALFDGSALIAHDHRIMARGHAEALVPMIAALPDKGRSSRILVSLGPGSFTGVRIGIAAARALGFAWGAEVLGYPTLALVAAQAQTTAPVTVCMNGGHGEWFVQDFADGASLGALQSLVPDAAKLVGAQSLIAGNRAEQFAALLEAEHTVLDLMPDARQINWVPEAMLSANLAPIYGRGPDATPMAGRPAA
ncbi:MAG: tRNA (adenosine(37)-N6)-threonylcarbamoyltransferase complex dimerization subunit type 1 TsaB [Erythrobacter sp.]|nr:tRNA (adenosine(37)-N6)-threonylcarbamoyltransferase complex dimerization subunit type 1 TsaB [Erythrobacter sp.]